MSWYYAVNGERQGPVSDADFANLVGVGTVTDQTLVWREGMSNWQPYSSVKPVASTGEVVPVAAVPGEETAVCAASGRIYPKREMIQYEGKWISAEHRDAYFQRLRQGVSQPGTMRFGGFWIRFVAKLIDSAVLFGVSMLTNLAVAGVIAATGGAEQMGPLAFMLYLGSIFVNILIGFGYNWLLVSKFQATLGKLALGLRIVRSDGSRLSNGRIIGRYFAEMLSSLVLCIGYIIAAFDPEKKALHDTICDTRVVYK